MPKRVLQSIDPARLALIERAGGGAAEAAQQLGERYRTGDGVERDERLALHWYEIGAGLGNAAAQNNLATMLLQGMGCAVDAAGAVRWYRASAEQGNAVAQFNLALRYLHGDGAAQDDLAAAEWFGRASDQGYAPALGQLGNLVLAGRGVERDVLHAAHLHMTAAVKGDVPAAAMLAGYRDELITLALDGHREAAFDLAHLYDWGLGTAKDSSLCWAWIRWAQEGCASLPADQARLPNLDAEVAESFRFYGDAIEAEERERGEQWLAALRAGRGRHAGESSS